MKPAEQETALQPLIDEVRLLRYAVLSQGIEAHPEPTWISLEDLKVLTGRRHIFIYNCQKHKKFRSYSVKTVENETLYHRVFATEDVKRAWKHCGS